MMSNSEITSSNDVHAYKHISAVEDSLCDSHRRECNLVWKPYINQESFCRPLSKNTVNNSHARCQQHAFIHHFLSNDRRCRARVPNSLIGLSS